MNLLHAGAIGGKVIAKSNGEPLIGANVYIEGTTVGAATDENGMYYIEIEDGTYVLVCDYVGYARQQVEIDIKGNVQYNFEMTEFLFAKTIEVVADRAKERETPVAFTNVKKQKIIEELGSQDIPMVLNTTPSVYATQQGGGAGDARVNIRGFNQRNIAIMINGVPVNDMENGWVYWSNWDGVGDATASIQVQRGLSAVNLATPSIGGTMNILTDPAAQKAGVFFKQELGSAGFLKTTISANSGMVNDKLAFSGLLVRKVGDGVVDKAWTDAWAYYFGASWNINESNRLEFYAIGAPQRHGQNLYKQNMATYDADYAKNHESQSWSAADDSAYYGMYDGKFMEKDRVFNQNWAPVSASYTGKQYWNGQTSNRYSSDFLNERENFYHKPQINLNWYSQLMDNLGLYSVFYFSGGVGGGTGTYGSIYRRDANGNLGDEHYKFYYGQSPWQYDWNETIRVNQAPADTYYVDKKPIIKEDGQSIGILRNSRNDQRTYGAIVKANYKAMDGLNFTLGIDWRTATIDHYREVRDLLGGEYYVDNSSDFWSGTQNQRVLGDKIAYNFTNDVNWLGGFLQGEYTSGAISLYGMFGYSTIKYGHTNHFKAAQEDTNGDPILSSGELNLNANSIGGYQAKGGISYRINRSLDVYGNVGVISKVPILDAVINDRTSEFINDPKNEQFSSIEGGANYSAQNGLYTVKFSGYYTQWKERTYTQNDFKLEGDEGLVVIRNINANYWGLELEGALQPSHYYRFDLAASYGNWKQSNNPTATYINYGSGADSTYSIYVNDLYVGDAPQTQVALSGTVFPVTGMRVQLLWRYYGRYYSDWNAITRTRPEDTAQSWQIPDYNLFDLHASYTLPWNPVGIKFNIFAHVFNLFDSHYVQDAKDNSQYNAFYGSDDPNRYGHTNRSAEVFFGMPRFFNLGLTITY